MRQTGNALKRDKPGDAMGQPSWRSDVYKRQRVSQLLTDERRYGRFQRSAAEANPSLKMTRTRLQHHTRLMAIGSHERKNLGSGVIQVEENIAGVAMLGIGQKINIMTLKVACAKKAHHRTACQLTRIPNPFSWTRFSGEAMNHADEIEIIRHGRELAAHSVPGKKKSAIAHGHENATKASRAYNDFSANGNNPLKSCLLYTSVQERIRKWEEAHPATQAASLNSLPSVPQDQQQQTQTQDHSQAQAIRPVFVKATTCDGKLASVLFSSFKEAISTSQRHELVRDLSDNGKMDTVLIIQIACEEHNNSVSVKSTYGMAKCFGPKNCHAALDGRTGNVLSCDPNGEPICGKELFKEFEYVLATTGISVKLE